MKNPINLNRLFFTYLELTKSVVSLVPILLLDEIPSPIRLTETSYETYTRDTNETQFETQTDLIERLTRVIFMSDARFALR